MVPHSTSAANHTCKDDTHMHMYTNAHTHTQANARLSVSNAAVMGRSWQNTRLLEHNTLDPSAHRHTHKGNDTPEVSQVNYM